MSVVPDSLRAVAIPEEAVRLAAQAELDYTVRCGWMKSRDEDAEAYDDELDIAMSHARLWLAAAHPVLVSAGLAAARADEREKIEKLEGERKIIQLLHAESSDPGYCTSCDGSQVWPCPTWQTLNGGNDG